MPSDQEIHAVLAAPILFFLTFVAIAVAATVTVWRVMRWRYNAVIDKEKELHALSRREVEYLKNEAERSTGQAIKQIEALKHEALKQQLPAEVTAKLDQLTSTTSAITSQLLALGQANSAATLGLWQPSERWRPSQPSNATLPSESPGPSQPQSRFDQR
jgi:hypothetical protein